jgi:RNA-directed DNA polymerase
MFDRSVQALYLMTIQPIAEETSDVRSYGFRPHKSAHDAITYLHLVLGNFTATRR